MEDCLAPFHSSMRFDSRLKGANLASNPAQLMANTYAHAR